MWHGCCWRHSPDQPDAASILLKTICNKDGGVQLKQLQQVERSMSDWVSGENASEHDPETEPFPTALTQTPPLGDCSARYDYDTQELVASGIIWCYRWIQWHWIKMFWKRCGSTVCGVMRNAGQGKYNQWPIWVCMLAKWYKATAQSSPFQLLWCWFVGFQMASIAIHLEINWILGIWIWVTEKH